MHNSIEFTNFEPSSEDKFYQLCDELDESTRRTPRFQMIVNQADETGSYDAAISSLLELRQRRREALMDYHVNIAKYEPHITIDGARQFIQNVLIHMSDPTKFLGNGSSAEVYALRLDTAATTRMICIKVIKDAGQYALGLDVHEELDALSLVHDLDVNGVAAPRGVFAFSGSNIHGLAMEHLNAVNLRRVLDGSTTEEMKDVLPKTFDINIFEKSLLAYIRAMHERGVIHNDLYLRNIMVDRQTGLPYVIDFGKAITEVALDKERFSFDDLKKKDFAGAEGAIMELRRWIRGRA